ncbi:KOW motif-containing protein [Sinanaerobacter chloroacetimidivorans]|uniref:KOW motif-containing protein n=1 Tax=Sinanaerobacter chloroacetimidivorans TaxID=2818044 RepID=A0A8J8B269_9FIRM|nr:KOW motif-containing protein [Sinanaerobacter chloroacetimidivorans]MBR0596950.1 KOW motif-containing protein [Sinanaerobacter chloroacetimidivorans]
MSNVKRKSKKKTFPRSEYEPICGDVVKIVKGRFKGMTGRIYETDTIANAHFTVKIDKTDEHGEFLAYIEKDHVE